MTISVISQAKQMPANWTEAFPDIQALATAMELGSAQPGELVFVDDRDLDKAQREHILKQVSIKKGKPVVLTPRPNVDDAILAIQHGALGYTHILSHSAILQEVALVVSHGGLWVGNALFKRVMAALSQPKQADPSQGNNRDDHIRRELGELEQSLSEKELAVASYVARGETNQEISERLAIKERTVKAHITSIFAKLGVRNRVELALKINQIGLDEVPGFSKRVRIGPG